MGVSGGTWLAVSLLVVTVTACGGGGAAPAAPTSGLTGRAVVDVGCPLQDSSPCPTRPIRAQLTVTRPDTASFTRDVTTNDRGAFQLPLDPGTYVVQARNTTGAPVPTARPVTVRVPKGAFTTVTITFDSGVRQG